MVGVIRGGFLSISSASVKNGFCGRLVLCYQVFLVSTQICCQDLNANRDYFSFLKLAATQLPCCWREASVPLSHLAYFVACVVYLLPLVAQSHAVVINKRQPDIFQATTPPKPNLHQ